MKLVHNATKYLPINDSLIPAAWINVLQQFDEDYTKHQLENDSLISLKERQDTQSAYNVLQGNLDYLETQGFLKFDEWREWFKFTTNSRELDRYMNNQEEQLSHYLESQELLIESLKSGNPLDIENLQNRGGNIWISPTLSWIKETWLDENIDELMKYKTVRRTFEESGLYTGKELTRSWKSLIDKAWYGTLITSYYNVYGSMDALSKWMQYGHPSLVKGESINREEWTNSLGSNAIIEKKVTPAVVKFLESQEMSNLLGWESVRLSGLWTWAWKLEQMVSKSPAVERVVAMDLSPIAVGEWRKQSKGNEKISFEVGNMLDAHWYKEHADKYKDNPSNCFISNFIGHDLDHITDEKRENFTFCLEQIRATHPWAVLILSDSFKVLQEVMMKHPWYQTSSFKHMHDISWQNLFFKEEFEEFMSALGFEVVREPITYSSMPWLEDWDERLPTVSTYVFKVAA